MNEISEIKEYAKKNAVPIMRDGGIQFICTYIKENNVKNILEIGTAIGYSAICFAQCGGDIHVTTIELDTDRFIKARQNISDCGLADRITVLNEDARTCAIAGTFELIFIDGPKAQYITFFEKYKEHLAENGVIISDNLSFHGMVDDLSLTHNYSTKKLVRKIRKYREFLKTNSEFETTFYDFGDGIAISRKRS